jgi:hypothetical protein
MGRFAGLGNIRTNQGGLYFEPGNYVVDVQEQKFLRGNDGLENFITAATIVESDNPARTPGQTPSQVIKIRPQHAATCYGDIKQNVGAMLDITNPDEYLPPIQPGMTQEESTDAFWDRAVEAVVSPMQPTRGKRMRLSCYHKTTKTGGLFTKHVWAPYEGPQPEVAPQPQAPPQPHYAGAAGVHPGATMAQQAPAPQTAPQAAPVAQAAPVQQAPVAQAAPVQQAPVAQAAPVQQAPVAQAAPVQQYQPQQPQPGYYPPFPGDDFPGDDDVPF